MGVFAGEGDPKKVTVAGGINKEGVKGEAGGINEEGVKGEAGGINEEEVKGEAWKGEKEDC
jgi:hypothetical protein